MCTWCCMAYVLHRSVNVSSDTNCGVDIETAGKRIDHLTTTDIDTLFQVQMQFWENFDFFATSDEIMLLYLPLDYWILIRLGVVVFDVKIQFRIFSVTSGCMLTLEISLVLLEWFVLQFVISTFVGSFTFFISVSFQQQKIFNFSDWFVTLYILCISAFQLQMQETD